MRTFPVIPAFLFISEECDKSLAPAGKWEIQDPELKINAVPVFPEREDSCNGHIRSEIISFKYGKHKKI